VSIKDKNAKSPPVIIAPTILVATKSIASSTTDNTIAPKIPVRSVDKTVHKQLFLTFGHCEIDVEIRIIARYTTAIPSITHKNASPTVITAVMRKNAVIMPIIILATIAKNGQVILQLHIFFTPLI
jgi:hypothetical protein